MEKLGIRDNGEAARTGPDLRDSFGRPDLKSMTAEELSVIFSEMGEKPFRAKQVYQWIHQKLAGSFEEMSSLSRALRQSLEEKTVLTSLEGGGRADFQDRRNQEIICLL